ncbi:hypothetical protein BD626DRAFT_634003 [Schizophyllum amplum]|uniref:Uncharacterized protein n=1 Tax=Schizophyllum amplum TaxID=97359 RepID=A0A550C142_9AGAR|nr:hypothetical protein BD626DRAFT_634003 [Auriculariopsis ampla]
MMPLCVIPLNKHRYRPLLTQSFHPLIMGQPQSMLIAPAPIPSSVDASYPAYLALLPHVFWLVFSKDDIVELVELYQAHPSHRRDRTFWNAFSPSLNVVLDFLDEVNVQATLDAYTMLGLYEHDGLSDRSTPDHSTPPDHGGEMRPAVGESVEITSDAFPRLGLYDHGVLPDCSTFNRSTSADYDEEIRRTMGELISSIIDAHGEEANADPQWRFLKLREVLIDHMKRAWSDMHIQMLVLQNLFSQHGAGWIQDYDAALENPRNWAALRDGLLHLQDGMLRQAGMLAEAMKNGARLLEAEMNAEIEKMKTR